MEVAMPFMQWDQVLSVSIEEIDDQHKSLISMINKLYDAAQTADRSIITEDIIVQLKNYFNEHFSKEEKYMLRYNYPEANNHRMEHVDFIKKVLDLETACWNGYAPYTAAVCISKGNYQGLIS
jgi:hemerythrin